MLHKYAAVILSVKKDANFLLLDFTRIVVQQQFQSNSKRQSQSNQENPSFHVVVDWAQTCII